jgi:hypothetical protein
VPVEAVHHALYIRFALLECAWRLVPSLRVESAVRFLSESLILAQDERLRRA